jgi:hypothetical protein
VAATLEVEAHPTWYLDKTMTKTIYWSQYESWLKCPQLWAYTYQDHLPKEPVHPGSPLDLGIRIGKCLALRLRNPDWKPTVACNRAAGSLDGLMQVLKEYDARYRSDRLLGPWKAEEPFTKPVDRWVSVANWQGYEHYELGCIVDGHAGDLIRETKVTDTPNWFLFRAQLLWNCFCAGVQQGELDIILRPGYHRPDWAFERRLIVFTEQDKLVLLADVEKFLDSIQGNLLWKNPNQCLYCPWTEKCWGQI